MSSPYDVLVAGGGPAGAAAAITLARAGRRVLLIDAAPAGDLEADDFKVGEGLPGAARRLLRDLGVLDAFLVDGHLPSYGNQSAWGGPELRTLDLVRDPDGHAWHLDRVRFDASLRRGAVDAGAEMRASSRVTSLSREDDAWCLELRTSSIALSEVRGHWLVDATGRAARLARQLGAGAANEPPEGDRLVAFAALYRPSPDAGEDPDTLTLVESEPDGWWYTARLPRDRRVVAFLTDHDPEVVRSVRSGAGFDARLERTLHVRRRVEAGEYHRVGEVQGGPASSCRLEPVRGEGWIAAGDAALAFDPLSSQGILTALYSGLRGAQAIDAVLSGGGERMAAYDRELRDVYEAYLGHRSVFYAQEQRWKNREFWRRRHELIGSESRPSPVWGVCDD